MNKIALVACLVFGAMIACVSCNKESNYAGLEDISFTNYPKVDGSTSARALNQMVACKILGARYEWVLGLSEEWRIDAKDIFPKNFENFLIERIQSSQTHGAFINLLEGNADIIITHRTISPDEAEFAELVGVTLIETPIASDAFVFVVHPNNPVKSLTIDEIQKIYTGEITNWSEVGGNDAAINAYSRPRNSGSEEVFRTLLMDGLEPDDFLNELEINSMHEVFHAIENDVNSICYTFRNYAEVIARRSDIPKIAINGIYSDDKTIENRTYPFVSAMYVAIRSDLDPNSMAYKLYEWLRSDKAKSTFIECGFLPK
jgi:ABC-type phosphate transport system, periplasmic component